MYVTDSAGRCCLPTFGQESVWSASDSIPIGFHAHNNLGLAIGNTLAAIEAGASIVDGTISGLGAGAGNAQLEVMVAMLNKAGYQHGVDLYKVMDLSKDVVEGLMHRRKP